MGDIILEHVVRHATGLRDVGYYHITYTGR